MPTTAANPMVILRPSMSARRPLVRAPIIAPIVKTDPKTPYSVLDSPMSLTIPA
uniref:Uncharacterized protein n=1 Tax=Arundo donax TaxID=35708 RepID=A0A0A9S9G2_ARUDO